MDTNQTPTVIKNNLTANLADQLIAAAQEFEQAAKQLKAKARYIRTEGLTKYEQDPIAVTREWEQHHIKAVAVRALRGCGLAVDFLQDICWTREN